MLVKVFLIVVLAAVAMSAPVADNLLVGPVNVQQLFNEWKAKHNKDYTEEQEKERVKIFEENVNRIIEHNKKYQAGEVTYTQGLNQFADLTQEEFSKTYLGARIPKKGGLSGAH